MANTEKELSAGSKAPLFCLSDQLDTKTCLKDQSGKWVVLYFYPKDNSPGCTIEAMDFSKEKKNFEKENAVIFGISPDSGKNHCDFIEKRNLSITLLSDSDHSVAEKYGVWGVKKLYGREFSGIRRSTFLVDPQGTITFTWYGVSVIGHAAEVLKKLKGLKRKN